MVVNRPNNQGELRGPPQQPQQLAASNQQTAGSNQQSAGSGQRAAGGRQPSAASRQEPVAQSRLREARPKNIEETASQAKAQEKKLKEFNIEQKPAYTPAATLTPQQEINPQSKYINAPSTQDYLDIEEIHNGVAVLKNGGMRMVLMVSAVNFSLKSEAEQNAIIYSFQNFLNSLSFPIQIVMQSRRLDLSAYIAKLRTKTKEEGNSLIRLQMEDYIGFIEQLLTVANIMEKKFYVVIPYQPIIVKKEGIWQRFGHLFGGRRKKEIIDFEMHRKELAQRTEVVAAGLGSVGLRAIQLNTLELAELYYSSYNPEMAARQKITSLADITTPVVETNKTTNP